MNQSFRRNTPRQALAAALLSSATTLGCAAEPNLPCPPTEPEVTGTALQAFCFVDPDVPVAGVAGGVVDEVIGDIVNQPDISKRERVIAKAKEGVSGRKNLIRDLKRCQ